MGPKCTRHTTLIPRGKGYMCKGDICKQGSQSLLQSRSLLLTNCYPLYSLDTVDHLTSAEGQMHNSTEFNWVASDSCVPKAKHYWTIVPMGEGTKMFVHASHSPCTNREICTMATEAMNTLYHLCFPMLSRQFHRIHLLTLPTVHTVHSVSAAQSTIPAADTHALRQLLLTPITIAKIHKWLLVHEHLPNIQRSNICHNRAL